MINGFTWRVKGDLGEGKSGKQGIFAFCIERAGKERPSLSIAENRRELTGSPLDKGENCAYNETYNRFVMRKRQPDPGHKRPSLKILIGLKIGG